MVKRSDECLFDHDDPSILWVSVHGHDGGEGTFESPFNTVARAISGVKPGNTIVLKSGVYSGDVTFDVSGTIHEPIRIVAEHEGSVEIQGACWFFYDASDCIVSGLTFKDSPQGAVAVIGACPAEPLRYPAVHPLRGHRRRFLHHVLRRVRRQLQRGRDCCFERRAPGGDGRISVGLMVGEGNGGTAEPLTDHIIRKNHFSNYGYGILVGASDSPQGKYGHITRVQYRRRERQGRHPRQMRRYDRARQPGLAQSRRRYRHRGGPGQRGRSEPADRLCKGNNGERRRPYGRQ